MKTIKKVLLIVLLIPVVLVIVSVFLPSHYRVVRSIQISAPPQAIFTNINTLKTWPEWTAWTVERFPYISKGGIVLEPSGDSVKVTWTNEGDLGWNPVSRYFGLFMDKFMGPDFEKGLLNLKQRVEPKSN